jgi:hypothetical protein
MPRRGADGGCGEGRGGVARDSRGFSERAVVLGADIVRLGSVEGGCVVVLNGCLVWFATVRRCCGDGLGFGFVRYVGDV